MCEERVSLRDDYGPTNGADQLTAQMDASADAGREIAAASAVLRGKEEVAEFDVFLCHNWQDKPAVRQSPGSCGTADCGRGWMSASYVRDLPWQPGAGGHIACIPAAAVIVGPARPLAGQGTRRVHPAVRQAPLARRPRPVPGADAPTCRPSSRA